ncbi:MAG: hypothetical protein DWQ01_02910 [Planctomycetota bacterium]|nr:MAG: hypothetical protein DWQ01_02910 [Planctomycetota bacterium]
MHSFLLHRFLPILFCQLLWVSSAWSQSLLWYEVGDSPRDFFGKSVCGPGDVDGDGFDDWLVGAPGDRPNGQNSGSAVLLSGRTGLPLQLWHGAVPDAKFGYAVAGAGDLNGDGVPDLAIASPFFPDVGSDHGKVEVFSGLDGSLLRSWLGERPQLRLGMSIAAAGDVDADGYDDLLVGVPWDDPNGPRSGSARLYSGFDGSLIYQWDGSAMEDATGTCVSGGLDASGDGIPDCLIGGPQHDSTGNEAGCAMLFSGATGELLLQWFGHDDGSLFGSALALSDDVNDDGLADVLIGAYNQSTLTTDRAGKAYVYSGADGSEIYQWEGDFYYGCFGISVSAAGDFNGDGIGDLLVGARKAGENGKHAGGAYLYSGLDGTLLFSHHGNRPSDRLGGSVSGAGDVNADGFHDLLLGADEDDLGGINAGSARVISGHPTPLTVQRPEPGWAGYQNTVTVSGAEPDNHVLIFASTDNAGISKIGLETGFTIIQMASYKLLGNVIADIQGEASVSGMVALHFSGLTLRFQAVEYESGRFAPLLRYTFP